VKYLFILLTLAILYIVFALISSFVYFTNGNPFFINKKIRIGSLIIILTTALSYGSIFSFVDFLKLKLDKIIKNKNIFILSTQHISNKIYTINLFANNTLKGEILNIKEEEFSFRITDNNGEIIQNGNIFSNDGIFDEENEEFEIIIDQEINTGYYIINFYSSNIEKADFETYRKSYNIHIIGNQIMCYFFK